MKYIVKLGLLSIILFALPCEAREEVEVRFTSLPPNCTVAFASGQEKDGGPGWVRLVLPGPETEELRFRLFKSGYDSVEVTIPRSALTRGGVVQWPLDDKRFIKLEPVYVRAVFDTVPRGAKIWVSQAGRGDDYIGKTGEPLQINLARLLSGRKDGTLRLKLTAAGYQDVEVPVPEHLFGPGKDNRWPARGSYIFSPLSAGFSAPFFWATRNPWLAFLCASLGMVLLSALASYLARKRRFYRQIEEWERRRASATQPLHLSGARLGQYRLLETLGRGGTASVFKGCLEDGSSGGREVAVKVFNLGPDGRKRLIREVKPLMKLSHPSLVRLYDWGEQDGFTYIVLEHVPGRTLRQELHCGPLKLEVWWELAEALIGGLNHAHQRGVVHGDVKPENILLPWHGCPKLTDFGLSRGVLKDGLEKFGGTPGYMAPESLSAREVTNSSDQYGLGVVLHEALSGGLPSQEGIIEEPIRHFLGRMLETEPADRYADLSEVQEAFENLKAQFIGVGCPMSEPARLRD